MLKTDDGYKPESSSPAISQCVDYWLNIVYNHQIKTQGEIKILTRNQKPKTKNQKSKIKNKIWKMKN